MSYQQGIRDIHQHVKSLPCWGGQVPQPEVVARRRHQKEDDQCKEPERLKGKLGHSSVARVADEQTHQRIYISQRMELNQRKSPVCESCQECGDPQVPSVVEQWKEPSIEPRKWPDTQHYVQKQECGRSECPNQQGLGCRCRVLPRSYSDKQEDIRQQERHHYDVVDLFLAVPADCAIFGAHSSTLTLARSTIVR